MTESRVSRTLVGTRAGRREVLAAFGLPAALPDLNRRAQVSSKAPSGGDRRLDFSSPAAVAAPPMPGAAAIGARSAAAVWPLSAAAALQPPL